MLEYRQVFDAVFDDRFLRNDHHGSALDHTSSRFYPRNCSDNSFHNFLGHNFLQKQPWAVKTAKKHDAELGHPRFPREPKRISPPRNKSTNRLHGQLDRADQREIDSLKNHAKENWRLSWRCYFQKKSIRLIGWRYLYE